MQMQKLDDITLLRHYTEQNSEEAFASLVTRYVNLVYSAALRHTRNPHQAEEITQAVFVILARKSRQLGQEIILSGWLYQTARLTAVTFIRSEIRRAHREQEAHMQTLLNETESDVWPQIAPLLDAAMAGLSDTDRQAVVLRFFEGKSMKEVGLALGASEDAAKMRLGRAVEKLRGFFTKRGIVLPAVVLTAAISANSVQAAPALLAKTATAVAFAQGAAASGSTLTLIKGTLKIMAWSKAKTAIVVCIGVLLTAGTATVTLKEIERNHLPSWQKKYDLTVLEKVPPQVKILPAIQGRPGGSWGDNAHGMLGLEVSALDIIQAAYGATLGRIIYSDPLPGGHYDFISNIPLAPGRALQSEIKARFGVTGRRERIETNVWMLTVRTPHAVGLRTSSAAAKETVANRDRSSGSYSCVHEPLSNLSSFLEDYLGTPVVDQTGLSGRFDIHLIGNSTPEGLKNAVLKELGLELVPGRTSIEYLVLEKAN